MYKAIEKIGGYKVGDEVPKEKAEIWMKMYLISPVQKVGNEVKEEKVVEKIQKEISKNIKKKEDELIESSGIDAMLDDYLNRNVYVVKKALSNDSLGKTVLDKLLKLEEKTKNRKPITKLIKLKLKSLE